MLMRLWRHRGLLTALVRRQYQLRYRQSFVGVAWALIPPLATLGVGAILFRGVLGVKTGTTSYAVFAMAGLVPWTFLANSLQQGITSVAQSLAMVTRLPFPRAVLPLSMVGLAFVDLVVAGSAFVIVALVTGEGLPVTAFWTPVLVLLELPLIVGVVLLGASLNVFARDIRLGVPLLVQLWLFLTPVMYSLSEVRPGLRTVYVSNPMTGIVEAFRAVLIDGTAPQVGLLAPAVAGGLALFALGWWYFASTEARFADAI
jgi:lipopolysaccharide transport system permease protein